MAGYVRKEAVFAAGEAGDCHPLDCRVAVRDLDTIFLATLCTVQRWRAQVPTPQVAYDFQDKNAFPGLLDAQCSCVVHDGTPRDAISQIKFQQSIGSEKGMKHVMLLSFTTTCLRIALITALLAILSTCPPSYSVHHTAFATHFCFSIDLSFPPPINI